MNYQLTSDYILIEGREPIDRKVFEKWATSYTWLEEDDLELFWDQKIPNFDPADMIQSFIDHQTAFTEFDGIKKGIDRICK